MKICVLSDSSISSIWSSLTSLPATQREGRKRERERKRWGGNEGDRSEGERRKNGEGVGKEGEGGWGRMEEKDGGRERERGYVGRGMNGEDKR